MVTSKMEVLVLSCHSDIFSKDATKPTLLQCSENKPCEQLAIGKSSISIGRNGHYHEDQAKASVVAWVIQPISQYLVLWSNVWTRICLDQGSFRTLNLIRVPNAPKSKSNRDM